MPDERRLSFTMDTNCIIDVAENRPAEAHVRAILAARDRGQADVALVASSASERQQGGNFLTSLDVFNQRRDALGFAGLPLLPSIGWMDVSFFDHALYGSEAGIARERLIYQTLFPNSPIEWAAYAANGGHDPDDIASPGYFRWRNQMLDAQALWAHDHAGRDVFVTCDARLKRLHGHNDFPNMVVHTPEEAAALL